MNRYPRGGPSRASADTLCQKCLQRGHYSYECKAAATDRPYIARPSRTQQLLNPKYAPKLSDVAPPEDLTRKQGVADEILAKKEEDRGRKRRRLEEHGRSASRSVSASSLSVSTISTDRSRSPSPPEPQRSSKTRYSNSHGKTRHSRSDRRERTHRRRRSRSRSSSSYAIDDRRAGDKGNHRGRRTGSRSRGDTPPARRSLRSPSPQQSRSRSPERDRERRERARRESPVHEEQTARHRRPEGNQAPRQRSLSPYSKRLALTQAMNR